MAESLCDERKLETLRASRLGQTLEMVNLFVDSIEMLIDTTKNRNNTISLPQRIECCFDSLWCRWGSKVKPPQRIEITLNPLRQRYSVSVGLTLETQIIRKLFITDPRWSLPLLR